MKHTTFYMLTTFFVILLLIGSGVIGSHSIAAHLQLKIQDNRIINSIMFEKNNQVAYKPQIYTVPTPDGFAISLTRYENKKKPPIILIHGMGGNHLMFDWDEEHSLAQYLYGEGWDVWLLDLRTHDGDGDFLFAFGSDREYIDRNWDFDNTLLKIDVVTAVALVKMQTSSKKIVLGGHSYGGYLAYAYAMLIGEENLSGIVTTGAAPYENPKDYQHSRRSMYQYGYFYGKHAYVRPFGRKAGYPGSKLLKDYWLKHWDQLDLTSVFYQNTTPKKIKQGLIYHGDAEAAGVCVDMFFGKDPYKYRGHWVDPQTLYDYSENLDKITVPILFIAGDKDPQDPSELVYKAFKQVSSKQKQFYSIPDHSHLDLLLGNNARTLVFPKITTWLEEIILNTNINNIAPMKFSS